MKKIIYILILGLILSITSCDEYLDVEPKGVVSPVTVEQLGKLLIGEPRFAFSNRVSQMMSDEFFVDEDSYKSLLKWNKRAYLWDTPYDPGDTDLDWRDAYYIIYLANYVLGLIDDAPLDGLTESDRNNVEAQALAIRAYKYFDLVNVYAPHYNSATASNDMTVPMLLEADIDAQLPRSSVEKIYNQIIGDLLTAVDLFPNSERPAVLVNQSKAGVYGLLSRVYLYMSEWSNVEIYSSLALLEYSTLEDYNSYGSKANSGPANELDATKNLESILHRTGTGSFCRDKTVYLNSDLVDLFEAGDLRFEYFVTIDTAGRYEYDPENRVNVFPLTSISTPEMYLNRAEAYANLDDISAALDDVNHLRSNRGTLALLTASSSQEAIAIILEEREREMMFRGTRWFDIRRLAFMGLYNRSITRIIDGVNYTLPENPELHYVEISPDVLEVNPLL